MYKTLILIFVIIIFNYYIVFGNINNIPDFLIEIQSGLEKLDKNIYKCKKEECKINLNVEKSFSGEYNISDYECGWDFGYGTFTTSNTDKKCNPGYVNYGTGIFDLGVKISLKNNKLIYKEENIKIYNGIDYIELDYGYGIDIISTGNSVDGNLISTGSIIENIINFSEEIIIQSGLELIDGKYICNKEVCSINLLYDEGLNNLSCEWSFGNGIFSTLNTDKKCNPGYVKYGTGLHEINLTVKNNKNFENYINLNLIFENIYEKELLDNTLITEESINNSSNNSSNNSISYSKENISLNNIEIQSGLEIGTDGYFCDKEECSINFNYENINSNLLCKWDFGVGIFTTKNTDEKCNPGYIKFKKGLHDIKLKIYDKNYIDNYKILELEFENIFGTEKIEIETEKIIIKKENEIIKNIYDNISDLSFGNILINPNGTDSLEYFELVNNGDDVIDIKGCIIDDKLKGGSKEFLFSESNFILPNSLKKIYKSTTKINLNNSGDELYLFCNNKLIDSLKWNYSIKSGFLLNHVNSEIKDQYVNVINTTDGDTITIEFDNGSTEKLRLIGTDTPETKDPRKIVEFFGLNASNFTRNALIGKRVYLKIDKNNYRDKYGRLLGFIEVNGVDFNKKLIEEGYAIVYDKFDFDYLNEYRIAQNLAIQNKKGMWEFIDSDLGNKIFNDAKNDEVLILDNIEEQIIDKLEDLKINNNLLLEKLELEEQIELIYLNGLKKSEDTYLNIPSNFITYNSTNLLEQKMYYYFSDNDFFENFRIIGEDLYKIDYEKSYKDYYDFIEKSTYVNLSKLKYGYKLYGKTIYNGRIKISLFKNNLYSEIFEKGKEFRTHSDNNGDFKINIDELTSGNYFAKIKVYDVLGNEFIFKKSKKYVVSKIQNLDIKINNYEKQYLDELQTFNYLNKNLVSLEKSINIFIKKDEKNKLKLLKKIKSANTKLTNNTNNNGSKLRKLEVKNNEIVKIDGNQNKNGIYYYFLIIIFSFILLFILLKKNKIV